MIMTIAFDVSMIFSRSIRVDTLELKDIDGRPGYRWRCESLHYGPTARRAIVDPVVSWATIVGSHHVEGVVRSNAGGFDAGVGTGQGCPVTGGTILPDLKGPVVVGGHHE